MELSEEILAALNLLPQEDRDYALANLSVWRITRIYECQFKEKKFRQDWFADILKDIRVTQRFLKPAPYSIQGFEVGDLKTCSCLYWEGIQVEILEIKRQVNGRNVKARAVKCGSTAWFIPEDFV